MSDQQTNDITDERLRGVALSFDYPPTPDIASGVRRKLAARSNRGPLPVRPRIRLAWGLAALSLLLAMASLLMVPDVQAFMRSLFRIGSINVVVATPVPTSGLVSPQASPSPSRLLDLAGESTLAIAQEQLPFPIKLPTYPADLGRPDRVFVQNLGGPFLILAWRDAAREDEARLVLYAVPSNVDQMEKVVRNTTVIQETTVSGERAFWVSSPHVLQFYDSSGILREDLRRLVEGNVLLWEADDVTYRLETALPLQEAVRIAESFAAAEGIGTPAPVEGQALPEWARNLASATTLDEARKRVSFPVRQPAFPRYLGNPDLVFVQELEAPVAILAWFTPGQRDRISMLLYQMAAGDAAERSFAGGQLLSEPFVRGQRARWVAAPHLLTLYDEGGAGNISSRRHVPGNVLMWEERGIAYRLETPGTLADAIRVAESLR